MRYEIKTYNDDMLPEWDVFVEQSNNGTIFHRQKYLGYHEKGRFNKDDRVIFADGKIVSVFPLSYRVDRGVKRGVSPYGASYGGIVTKNISTKRVYAILDELMITLSEDGYRTLDMSFPPMCYHRDSNVNVEYILLKSFKTEMIDRGMTSVVQLDGVSRYSDNYRRNLRKAISGGVTVEESDDLEVFYELLERTIVQKHGSEVTHRKSELQYLKCQMSKEVRIYLGIWEGKPISGVLLLENSGPCVLAFYNCHHEEYASVCSLHLVFDRIIAQYTGAKRYLDLGLTDKYSSEYNWGLFQFKEGMGAVGMCRNYYRIAVDETANKWK